MLGPFRRKRKIPCDAAVEQFITHCGLEGRRIEASFSTALERYCDGVSQQPPLSEILARPLISFRYRRVQSNPRTIFAAHCYAMALSKGLESAYEFLSPFSQARDIDWRVARLIAEQEVGPGQARHAPNPYPEGGGHISYAPDTLVGGVSSQQLTLLQCYRRFRTTIEALSMFCLAFHIVPAGAGIGMKVLREIPRSRHAGVASYDFIGYRRPEPSEVDERLVDLEILAPDQVLAPLPTELRNMMLATIDGVDAFWQSFSKNNVLAWR